MSRVSLTDALRAEYRTLFSTCVTRPERVADVERLLDSLIRNRATYESVGTPLNIPWFFVAVIHNMESSQKFTGHLHNGDPLTARTRQVPAGRPRAGTPPFSWKDSAIDALTMHDLNRWTDWSVAGALYQAEAFNGWGYRRFHPEVKSPYLWSFSTHYGSGKYVADGTWSDTAKSQQCGAAVLLRRMTERGLIAFADQPLPADGQSPLVVRYARSEPTDPQVIEQAKALQRWLTTHTGIYLRPDGWAGERTSNAYKAVTGRYLPGDPRE